LLNDDEDDLKKKEKEMNPAKSKQLNVTPSYQKI